MTSRNSINFTPLLEIAASPNSAAMQLLSSQLCASSVLISIYCIVIDNFPNTSAKSPYYDILDYFGIESNHYWQNNKLDPFFQCENAEMELINPFTSTVKPNICSKFSNFCFYGQTI